MRDASPTRRRARIRATGTARPSSRPRAWRRRRAAPARGSCKTALSATADAWTLGAGQATILEVAPAGAWSVLPTGWRPALAEGLLPPPLLEILRAWVGPMGRRPSHKPNLLACVLGQPPANAHQRLARRMEA